ncbi:MAG: hypothetical protein DI532_23015 [Azospirillum brasilense]|nr:MAG: hypothetical protein DI532_23015 [Azospirillum brasilense]
MLKVAGWILAGLVGLAILGSLSGGEPSGNQWRVVGRLDGDTMWRFVRLASGAETSRAVYDEAASRLCGQPGSPRICFLHFFGPNDAVPADQPRRTFFENGGFRSYPTLATYARNQNSGLAEFGSWDCDRAGVEGAPLSALCGVGVKETYEAVLKVAGRTSTASACGWPPTEDVANFERFLATVADLPRREQYRQAFAQMNTGRGPDDRADCTRLRERLEANARQARDRLGMPQPPAASRAPTSARPGQPRR